MTNGKWPERVAIVDDDAAVREGLSAILRGNSHQVTAFESGEAFLVGLRSGAPDAAIIDLRLEGIDGIELLERLSPLQFPVIMISGHGDISAAVRAIKRGAADFIEKPFRPEDIEAALVSLQSGETGAPGRSGSTVEDVLQPLTPRERDVAFALHDGLTNKEIARTLGVSPRTVEVHRSRIFAKMNVRGVAGLVRAMAGTG